MPFSDFQEAVEPFIQMLSLSAQTGERLEIGALLEVLLWAPGAKETHFEKGHFTKEGVLSHEAQSTYPFAPLKPVRAESALELKTLSPNSCWAFGKWTDETEEGLLHCLLCRAGSCLDGLLGAWASPQCQALSPSNPGTHCPSLEVF